MEFSGSAFLPGAREKRKGSLGGKPPNFGEPLLPRFALLTDDLLIVNVPSLTEGVADRNAEWPREISGSITYFVPQVPLGAQRLYPTPELFEGLIFYYPTATQRANSRLDSR
jgi:hypothetical protein